MKTVHRNSHEQSIFLAAIILVLTILACQSITIEGGPMPNPSPDTNSTDACLKGIFPGKTTRNEVLTLLGNPLATQQVTGQETLSYASAIYGQLNSIVIQNEVVVFVYVVQAEDNLPKWSEIKAQYGEPIHTAYSNYSEGTKTFAFPERGLSFIADPKMDVVFIRNCFVPMSLEEYMRLYGNSLPTEDPFDFWEHRNRIAYNTSFADETHARGLSIGLKNDPDQVGDLLNLFDWALTEDCFFYDWCEQMLKFLLE